jgi:hypothetical protein
MTFSQNLVSSLWLSLIALGAFEAMEALVSKGLFLYSPKGT